MNLILTAKRNFLTHCEIFVDERDYIKNIITLNSSLAQCTQWDQRMGVYVFYDLERHILGFGDIRNEIVKNWFIYTLENVKNVWECNANLRM